MINKNFNINKYQNPFPHIIIENFFEENFFVELEKNFPNKNNFKKNNVGRMHGDTTYGDDLYFNLLNKSKHYNDLHNWVYSKDFINYFLEFFRENFLQEKDLLANPFDYEIKSAPIEIGKVFNKYQIKNTKENLYLYPRLDLGFGIENYGKDTGGKGPHIDNPQRLISILFYVGGYDTIMGGEHRMYKKNKNDLIVDKIYPPKRNLLIASLQNNDAFHDVNPIIEINGQRNAYYMAISSSAKIWKDCKYDKLNIKYNNNRIKKSFVKKILSNIF